MSTIIFLQEEIIGTAYLAASYLEDSGFDKTKKVLPIPNARIWFFKTVHGFWSDMLICFIITDNFYFIFFPHSCELQSQATI